MKKKVIDYKTAESDSNELKFFMKVAAFLLPDISNTKGIIDQVANLVRPRLSRAVREIQEPAVREWISDKESNRKAYNRLTLILINLVLSREGFKIVSVDRSQFDSSNFDGYGKIDILPKPPSGIDFITENGKGSKIFFCFFDEQKEDVFRRISKGVFHEDKNSFQKICCLILPTQEWMMKCREVEWADNWPRGFFIDFKGLLEKAREIDQARFGHLEIISSKREPDFRSLTKIDHFTAKVTKNIAVGADGDPKHFIIRFKAPELKYAVPGQFVMIDTLPIVKRKKAYQRKSISFFTTSAHHAHYHHRIDLTPVSFLKRPFSIHRAFYKNFELNYLKNISLPPTLASITHIVFPDEFEIFYKILEDGTGTNELKQMKEGNTFQILGPLGRAINPFKWRSAGVEEVHIIGGGIGMAPLIFFGQALRYYSIRIKAFIGIDRIDTLLYPSRSQTGCEDDPQKAYAYIDNLLCLGLSQGDISLSYEEKSSAKEIRSRLPGINYYNGLISQQYESYIKKVNSTPNILALTCGPPPMLKALAKITSKFHIPMKVLMEKRMGCGIGVCMSCVCRTKDNNKEKYSRVCIDGPLFDAEAIVWE
jgi:dihydroorotate dehydrogenase electron transfer subunit